MGVDLNVGSGGRATHKFISEKIVAKLKNGILEKLDDSAVLSSEVGKRFAMTTDSYVVSPLFFPGGDIGRLAVSGTCNDLATSGAVVKALSLSFIIEEGCSLPEIERIIDSIKQALQEANTQVVTGDTKVVEKGKGDKIFINTCGIGFIDEGINLSTYNARAGDKVFITGEIGDHEITIMKEKRLFDFDVDIKSDVAPLNLKVNQLLNLTQEIRCIKDPTRGGVASALHEIATNSNVEIIIQEESLPVNPQVRTVCDLLGLDPLYLANEGKMIIIAPDTSMQAVFKIFPKAAIIGTVTDNSKSQLLIETSSGGIRKASMLETVQLPRIC